MAAVSDTLNEREVDEIIISTLPAVARAGCSFDQPSKVRGVGKP